MQKDSAALGTGFQTGTQWQARHKRGARVIKATSQLPTHKPSDSQQPPCQPLSASFRPSPGQPPQQLRSNLGRERLADNADIAEAQSAMITAIIDDSSWIQGSTVATGQLDIELVTRGKSEDMAAQPLGACTTSPSPQ